MIGGGRPRPWAILAVLLMASVAVFVVHLKHGEVEAVGILCIAWIWAIGQWRKHQLAEALLQESIVQLKETVSRWASGDLEARVYLDQEDPLDSLAHGMNGVAEVLKERTRDLGEDKDRMETILTSMANGIIIFGHGLRISLINQAALRLFAIEEVDVHGRHVLEIIRDTGLLDALDRVTRDGVTMTQDWSPVEDENVVIECTIAPINQPVGGLGAVLVARDVTSQRQVNRLRQDFVANVSHELQTPLTVIKGFTETLLDDPNLAMAPRFLELINEETNRMTRLVDDLLALSRMEHHSLPVRWGWVDVTLLVESTVTKLQGRAEQQGLTLVSELPQHLPLVWGDSDLLSELFINLISNAIQYTPEGGSVRIDSLVDPASEMVAFRVRDTGIGIPASDLTRIFERFYRVDRARSRASGGTGLGLAIVKHISEIHRGRIQVKSVVGQGSEFTVWLTTKEARQG
jgi:two-component system phosphate regulon sensor histidine kinase PhoR